MDLWIGPAIVAALVSALVSAAGWFVTSWQAQALEQHRRDEKVHDYQVALRAEIASDLLSLQVGSRDEMLGSFQAVLELEPSHRPILPRLARNMVFEQVVREIHLLPSRVISAVIGYQSLRQSIDLFIEDIRAAQNVNSERLLLMVSDYVDMLDRLEILASNAVAALEFSLMLSKSDAVPPSQGSAWGRAGAEQSASAERSVSP
ncbi:hypothetical protein SAMN05428969_0354 [Devosia sp. YR412]|uniref:hypothetical protein n=1 Tax=Devosia sp. YR412 TaxID=1881030 RepID=UPI0008D81635|nr:hypothetical protein [Devosia sp. YR412]SEP66141.1 hypothetical protein SAMN05428969_0354 [Devosia sp. YR412]